MSSALGDGEQARVNLLVSSAEDRLQRQLAEADAIDAKARGVLALAVAAIALLVATHNSINRFWWIPTVGLAVASALLMLSVRPRRFDVGPDLRWLYDHWSRQQTSAADAAREMLSELLLSLANNLSPMRRKEVYFKLGFAVLVLSLLGSIPVALVRPSSDSTPRAVGLSFVHGPEAIVGTSATGS